MRVIYSDIVIPVNKISKLNTALCKEVPDSKNLAALEATWIQTNFGVPILRELNSSYYEIEQGDFLYTGPFDIRHFFTIMAKYTSGTILLGINKDNFLFILNNYTVTEEYLGKVDNSMLGKRSEQYYNTKEEVPINNITERKEVLGAYKEFIKSMPRVKEYIDFIVKYDQGDINHIFNELEETYPGIKNYIFVRENCNPRHGKIE